jgi:hypothetical protein
LQEIFIYLTSFPWDGLETIPRVIKQIIPMKNHGNYLAETKMVDSWLAGFQPVRNTRAVLSMVSASDDARVSKRA